MFTFSCLLIFYYFQLINLEFFPLIVFADSPFWWYISFLCSKLWILVLMCPEHRDLGSFSLSVLTSDPGFRYQDFHVVQETVGASDIV